MKHNILIHYPYPGIGDFIVITPLFRNLLYAFPEADLYLLTRKHIRFKSLLPLVPLKKIFYYQDTSSFFKDLKLLYNLKSCKFSHVFNFHHAFRLKIPFYLLSQRVFSTHNFNEYHPYKIFKILFNNLGISAPFKYPEILIPPQWEKYNILVNKWLNEKKIKKFIVIIPGTTEKNRLYPIDRWQKIIEFINHKYPEYKIIVNISKYEKKLKPYFQNYNCIIFDTNDLIKLLFIIKKATIIISNDTGPMHIAYALKRPTITIMKRCAKIYSYPYSPYAKPLIPEGFCTYDCSNCDILCIREISLETLKNEINNYLLNIKS